MIDSIGRPNDTWLRRPTKPPRNFSPHAQLPIKHEIQAFEVAVHNLENAWKSSTASSHIFARSEHSLC